MTSASNPSSSSQAGNSPSTLDDDQALSQSLWQACMDVLAQELPEQQFNTWIKPLVVQSSNDLSKVTIFIANRFKLDWVRAQYASRISVLLEKMYGQPIALELALMQREAAP